MADRTIDILLNMQAKGTGKLNTDLKITQQALKDIETQANRTREKMEKLAGVGRKLAVTGGLIVAPFIIAMKKYVDATKETEPTSRKLVELGKRWEESQVRIGRVTAEILLPALEKALNVVDKITAFAEANPGAVKAALGIGGTLVALGGLLSIAASIMSTIATVQGLAAGFLGANAAGLAATAVPSGAGIAAAIGPALLAVMTNPLTWAIAGLVLIKPIMNYLLGTNQTWKDIAITAGRLGFLISYGFTSLLKGIGGFFSSLGQSFMNALRSLGEWIKSGLSSMGSAISSGIAGLFGGTKDSGGMVGKGLFANAGEREFVMSNRTTRAAESAIGGQLTQDRLLQALGGGRKISYYDNRRIDSKLSVNDRRIIRNDTISAMAGAL